MPIIKADNKVIYYAHVPKCGGSSVSSYLEGRFGAVAFVNTSFTQLAPEKRWSRTSPQHVDAATLASMFPAGFFDAVFTIVRHPLARVISAYHFQKERERTVPADVGFSEWLLDLEERLSDDRFIYDNHLRPMDEIVPEGAHVFYMEHGLDAMVPWLDGICGNEDGPRRLAEVNKRGDFNKGTTEKVKPSTMDREVIQRIYGKDFRRFGYSLDEKLPAAPAPTLSEAYLAARAAYKPPRRGGRVIVAALDALRRRG